MTPINFGITLFNVTLNVKMVSADYLNLFHINKIIQTEVKKYLCMLKETHLFFFPV